MPVTIRLVAHGGSENGEMGAAGASVARARARLALRAEQAWGMSALIDVAPRAPRPGPEPEAHFCASPAPQINLLGDPSGAKTVLGAMEEPFSAPPPRQRRIELLKALDEGEIRACNRCTLCGKRTNTVFGEGDPEAQLMFIGEGPGETEDATGRPFVGRAGALLDKMICGMGLKRERVYIANVVKCRPPNNRVPTAQEVSTCTPYLHKQIEWIRPRVIVTLGLPATRHLLETTASMGALRGRWNQWHGIRLMPTYHPAFLLRSYTPQNRRIVWQDLQQVMAELGLALPRGSGIA